MHTNTEALLYIYMYISHIQFILMQYSIYLQQDTENRMFATMALVMFVTLYLFIYGIYVVSKSFLYKETCTKTAFI